MPILYFINEERNCYFELDKIKPIKKIINYIKFISIFR